MDTATANAIYDLLVLKAGALEHWRDSFVTYIASNGSEYRFQGNLGFGGKFYNDHRWRINCYPEDASDERIELIVEVNTILEQMRHDRQAKG
jgi:hypothetical protein